MTTTLPTPTLTAEPGLNSVIWAEFLAPVLAGVEPFVRQLDLPSHADGVNFDDLGSVGLDLAGDDWSFRTIKGAGWTALLTTSKMRDGAVTIRAADLATAKSGAALFAERIPEEEPSGDTEVAVDFWHVSEDVYRRSRQIEAPAWAEIAANYPDEVRTRMEALLAINFDPAEGRLLLWHGPPGTGKTTALRALARSWVEQCRVQILLDPERIFSSSSNLFEVLIDDVPSTADWRLIVVEDADELIRADAKERVGQALSRLLNLTDGLLGQGTKVLTLVTTNEPIGRLHPALVRPGRCLAELEFRAFTAAEARRRWPERSFPAVRVTLGEGLRPDGGTERPRTDLPIGLLL
jgi:hypothetical protein